MGFLKIILANPFKIKIWPIHKKHGQMADPFKNKMDDPLKTNDQSLKTNGQSLKTNGQSLKTNGQSLKNNWSIPSITKWPIP